MFFVFNGPKTFPACFLFITNLVYSWDSLSLVVAKFLRLVFVYNESCLLLGFFVFGGRKHFSGKIAGWTYFSFTFTFFLILVYFFSLLREVGINSVY